MIRNTLKMLVVTLVAACALSSIAEAATPTKTRHRTKHSSRVSSGAAATTGTKPTAKKEARSRAPQSQREHDKEDAGQTSPEHEAALTPAS